jgi:hypothetical protein
MNAVARNSSGAMGPASVRLLMPWPDPTTWLDRHQPDRAWLPPSSRIRVIVRFEPGAHPAVPWANEREASSQLSSGAEGQHPIVNTRGPSILEPAPVP